MYYNFDYNFKYVGMAEHSSLCGPFNHNIKDYTFTTIFAKEIINYGAY